VPSTSVTRCLRDDREWPEVKAHLLYQQNKPR
jgi:hypothetical protein